VKDVKNDTTWKIYLKNVFCDKKTQKTFDSELKLKTSDLVNKIKNKDENITSVMSKISKEVIYFIYSKYYLDNLVV
tara:strand:- start:213 stop:440 length:228 start_codon:yes stop_codon:yes gene_type:complete